jgi:hypothetical protein
MTVAGLFSDFRSRDSGDPRFSPPSSVDSIASEGTVKSDDVCGFILVRAKIVKRYSLYKSWHRLRIVHFGAFAFVGIVQFEVHHLASQVGHQVQAEGESNWDALLYTHSSMKSDEGIAETFGCRSEMMDIREFTVMEDALSPIPRPHFTVPAAITSVDLVSAFLSGRNPRTLAAYAQDLEAFVRFLGASSVREAVALQTSGTHGQANACCRSSEIHSCKLLRFGYYGI